MNNNDSWKTRTWRVCLILLLGVAVSSHSAPVATDESTEVKNPRARANFTFRNGEIHTRTVELAGDHAVAEGDMILGRAEDFFDATGKRAFKGVSNSAYGWAWPNGVVPYYINANLPEISVERIKAAIEHWNSFGTITLVRREPSNAIAYPDYIDFVDSNRCASWLGYQAMGPQQIYIGKSCSEGNMIHEIGHALGLLHEHTRPDRDSFVKIHWDRIQPDMNLNFEIVPGSVALGEYDYGSIMHYGESVFSIDGSPTLEPIQATTATIGQRITTSVGDRESVVNLYQSDLTLVSSAASRVAGVGSEIEIAHYVTNNSSTGANTLEVVMPVPGGSTMLSYSADAWSCSQSGAGENVLCKSPVLVAGAATTVVVSVSADAGNTGPLFFDATLTSRTPDANANDNSDSTMVSIDGSDGGAPLFAAAKRQASTNELAPVGNNSNFSGGSGAFSWQALNFLLALTLFSRLVRVLRSAHLETGA